jgi:hypothetical protein
MLANEGFNRQEIVRARRESAMRRHDFSGAECRGSESQRPSEDQSLREPVPIETARNRMAVESKRTLGEARRNRCQGRVESRLLRYSRSGAAERSAALQPRYVSRSAKWPRILNPVKASLDFIDLQAVYAKKEKPPKGKEGMEWLLADGEPASNSEEAYGYAGCRARRWKMERFHCALKGGCWTEKL